MEAKRRWATGAVAVVAIAAGVGGGAFLWKEAFPTDTNVVDGGPAGSASADARPGRGKSKSAKRGGRPGKPRSAPRHGSSPSVAQGGGAGGGAGAGGAGGGAGAGGNSANSDEGQGDEGDDEVEDFQPPFRGRGPAGPTYEQAIASNKQEITLGAKPEPDLTDAQLTGPMHNGAFVGECGAPDRMKVTVRVAIKMGHAVGVSVTTSPPDPDIAGCIDRYVRTFSWPSSSKMDSFTTTY